ncbi:DUF488 family protein [Corynebacterium uropygiale]|uniref:DUF488 family protein n=1 Tax=Corynebacterium uropygiale TaxID=1775911 RepID=A0A9X1QTP0_9CORY|nr:DUF488 family protein [Corynebacterium uropygiale]MCF4007573.1 DUF488 family protein [Corynebacterium uropygiale]
MARETDVHTLKIHDYLKDPGLAQGAVVLVDRLWPRGIKKADVPLDAWLKDVAPSPDLRRWFHHEPERFEEFSRRYREELAVSNNDVESLEKLAEKGPVTLLFAARDRDVNHAVVLASWLADRLADGNARPQRDS